MRTRRPNRALVRASICFAIGALFAGDAHATKICIDPGHGGTDPGAVGCGLHESDVVLDVGHRLRDQLVAEGLKVCMTRDTDVFVSLAARADYANANGADRFVSLHCNAASVVATGIETYCYSGSGPTNAGYKLRNAIQKEMVSAWPLADRGGKSANFYVLKYTAMPATLSEMGFINNCQLDATFQSDPAHRAAAATAHLDALRSHLGLPPPASPPEPPSTPTAPPDEPSPAQGTGVVEGYVYEDRGDGRTDIRLPGAEISPLETGRAAIAGSVDAAWRFELQPGRYTFVAALEGYAPGERRCEATAGRTQACAIGLRRIGSAAELGEVSVAPISDTPGAPPESPELEADGGCTLGGHGGRATPLLLLLGAAGLWLARRRRRAALILLLAAGLVPAAAIADGDNALRARETAPFARLAGVRAVAQGELLAPVLSPTADRVLFTRYSFAGLFVATLEGEPQGRQLSGAPRAGYRPVWRADGRAVGLRPRYEPFAGRALAAIDLQGAATAAFDPTPGYAAIQQDDCVYLTTPAHTVQVACGGDKYFAPQLAADRQHLVYCGLRRGVLVYRLADRRTIALGPGHQPAIDGTGRLVLFVRAGDDGERLTAADLWIADLRDPGYRVAPLTRTADRLEQHPSLSRDGTSVAFSAGGAIFVGRLAVPAPPR